MTKSLSNSRTEIHFSLHKPSYTEIVYLMNDITAQRQLKRATINAICMLSAQRKVPVEALEIIPKFLFGKGTILEARKLSMYILTY